jgi:hypothetical protein
MYDVSLHSVWSNRRVETLLKPYSNKRGEGSDHPPKSRARQKGRDHPSRLDNTGNVMVLLTIASVVISAIMRVAWLTPILHVAAVFPFYYSAMKQHRHRWSLALAVRWAAALFVTTIALGVFVPERTEASLLLSARTIAGFENWLTASQAAPPADYSYILWGLAAFLVGSLISGGLVGFLIGSATLAGAASGALFLFEHGRNIVQITLVVVPPWQWSTFACGALLVVPTSLPFFERFLKIERVAESKQVLRIYMYLGATFFVLSLLLRLVTAGAWRSLLQRWTIF